MSGFFHGSGAELTEGLVLRPRGEAYEADWAATDFYAALERWRPPECLAHRDAVFMVAEIDDIDLAGGSTDWCAEVVPIGPVTRHDLNWSSRISCLVSEGHGIESAEVRSAAEAYWSGLASPDESVWEYMAPAARVLRCEPYDTFDLPGP